MGWAWQSLCGRINENHLIFASKGDMQAMNHNKLHHVNQDRLLNSKWCYELSLHFIVTCSYQVLVKVVIKVSKNKGHSQLVMNEGGRIWNQKETKRNIKSELLKPLSYTEVVSSNRLKLSHFISSFVQFVWNILLLFYEPWNTSLVSFYIQIRCVLAEKCLGIIVTSPFLNSWGIFVPPNCAIEHSRCSILIGWWTGILHGRFIIVYSRNAKLIERHFNLCGLGYKQQIE